MKFRAHCLDCPRVHELRFNTYDERADWVGKHRVATAHRVSIVTEADEPGDKRGN